MSSSVRYEVVERVAVLTIDNPPVNALSTEVWTGIDEGVARGLADGDVDAIVITGAGPTFVAGADSKVFDTVRTREQSLARSVGVHALLRRIEDAAKPIVAAIHGNALGGGNELAMACHYRMAAADAKIGQPEVTLGLIPGAGGTQRLPRLCGAERALRMCTDGKPVSAREALDAGLIDRISEGDLVIAAAAFAREKAPAGQIRRTRTLSGRIADVGSSLTACHALRASLPASASIATTAIVDAIEAGVQNGFDAGSARERELFADCVTSIESRSL